MLVALLAALALAKPPAPAPPPEPAPPPTLDDGQRAAFFTAWATALASGNREAAATALLDIIDNPMNAQIHGEAFAHLGELFEAQGLELAAVGAYGRGIALDPVHNAPLVGKALALAEKVGEPGYVAEAVGNNVGIRVDGAVRNQLSVVAARYNIDKDSWGPALAILMMGDKTAPRFEEIELLRGIALSAQGRHKDAVDPLLAAAAMGIAAKRDEDWMNVVELDVARAYYSAGDYGNAIVWYAKIDRASDWWLDAQFERAWAHFRGNDTNGALAMLYNHQSPFFEDLYQPEVDLLRAYSFFVMCKFPEATKAMDAFAAKYEPIKAELASLSVTPEQAFEDVVAFRAGKPTRIPPYLLRQYQHEQRLDDAEKVVAQADAELEKAAALGGRAGALAADFVRGQRDARIRAEGNRVLARVDRARAELDSFLSGLEITRLDLLALETKMYERAAATGVLDYGANVDRLKQLRKTKKGFRVWPWQGEYWADELGWYVFSAAPDCPDSMRVGEGAAP
jgi:hypothetical protein